MNHTPPARALAICAYFDMDGTVLARNTLGVYLQQLRA